MRSASWLTILPVSLALAAVGCSGAAGGGLPGALNAGGASRALPPLSGSVRRASAQNSALTSAPPSWDTGKALAGGRAALLVDGSERSVSPIAETGSFNLPGVERSIPGATRVELVINDETGARVLRVRLPDLMPGSAALRVDVVLGDETARPDAARVRLIPLAASFPEIVVDRWADWSGDGVFTTADLMSWISPAPGVRVFNKDMDADFGEPEDAVRIDGDSGPRFVTVQTDAGTQAGAARRRGHGRRRNAKHAQKERRGKKRGRPSAEIHRHETGHARRNHDADNHANHGENSHTNHDEDHGENHDADNRNHRGARVAYRANPHHSRARHGKRRRCRDNDNDNDDENDGDSDNDNENENDHDADDQNGDDNGVPGIDAGEPTPPPTAAPLPSPGPSPVDTTGGAGAGGGGGGASTPTPPATDFADETALRLPLVDGVLTALVVLDFNGDGRSDLVVGRGAGLANVALVAGITGTFQPAAVLPATATDTRGLAVGDLLGDARADLLEANNGADRLLLNVGGSFFDLSGNLPASSASTSAVALLDVDLDGDNDVYLGIDGGQDRLLMNFSGSLVDNTSLRMPVFTAATRQVLAGDLNGDGATDLVATTADGAPVILLNNKGFASLLLLPDGVDPAVTGVLSVALVDTDSDGDLDMITGAGSGNAPQVFLNNGSGRFTTPAAFAPPVETQVVRAARRGTALLVAEGTSAGVRVFERPDGGAWAALSGVSAIADTRDLALVDLDGDGRLDVVAANAGDRLRAYVRR